MVHNNKHVPHKGVRKEFCLGGPPSLLESVFLSKKRNHFGSTHYVCTGQQQRDLRCLQRNAKMNAMYQMNAMYKRRGQWYLKPSSISGLPAHVMHVRYYCVFLFYFMVVVTPPIIFIETVAFHVLGQLHYTAICQWDKYDKRALLHMSVPLIHPSLKGSKAWTSDWGDCWA